MNVFKGLILAALLGAPCFAAAESITDKLITRVIVKAMPVNLYEGNDIPWQYGKYSVSVKKADAPSYTANNQAITATVPLHVTLTGNAAVKQIVQVNVDCSSSFSTQAVLVITPVFSENSTTSDVSIDVPIEGEPTMACKGFTFPAKPFLNTLIRENKATWEKQAEQEINALFKQAGL